jgi:hypothetical protein
MNIFYTIRGFCRCLTSIDGLILLVILFCSASYMYAVRDTLELVIVSVIGIMLIRIKGGIKK